MENKMGTAPASKVKALQRTVANNLYIMKFAWKLCPSRVLCAGLFFGLEQFEYLFFSGVFMKRVVALLENSATLGDVLPFLFFTLALFLAVSLFQNWYENYCKPIADVNVYKGLYHTLYEKACNSELGCFEDSDFYNRYMLAMADSDKRLTQTVDNVWNIVIGVVAVAVSWVMLFRIDAWTLLFVLGPIIGNFVFAKKVNRYAYQMYEESMIFRRIADYVNRVVHLADYAKELRMTNIFHVMQKKQRDATDGITGMQDKYARRNILNGWGYLYFTFVIMFEGVIFYGAYRTIVSKTMALSDFTILTTLMTSVSWILIGFTDALLASFRNSFFIQNLREFLDRRPAIPEDADGILPESAISEIEFRDVSFSYKKEKPVLKHVSFRMKSGQHFALVGYNGAGKTTLIKLLMRLYDPTEGAIYVNGIDIRRYNLKAYRALFSTAFQDGKILAASVRDNVWMGRPTDSSTDEKIWNALEQAGISDTIRALPNGLDSILTREFSEAGVVLSGGQCQKILAARAFARAEAGNDVQSGSPILIFDEPSSALDPIAEHDLMERIKQAAQGKILLLISHRLSSIQDMENILLLKNGRIAEEGCHAKLMALEGEYAHFYRMQSEKYRTEGSELSSPLFPDATAAARS